jgi:hypothetical protein
VRLATCLLGWLVACLLACLLATDRQTDRQAGRLVGMQTDRQTDRLVGMQKKAQQAREEMTHCVMLEFLKGSGQRQRGKASVLHPNDASMTLQVG